MARLVLTREYVQNAIEIIKLKELQTEQTKSNEEEIG
jgi:hypothetical protein